MADYFTRAGAFCAASGTVVASMSDQMPTKVAGMGQVGIALYLLGWALYDTGVLLKTKSKTKKALVISFGALVVISYIAYLITKSPFAMIGVVASWISLGISLGIDDNNRVSSDMWFSVLGSTFVALGIVSLALFQRRSCIVDGPGHALCGSGWTLLALL
jgi:hypothetical protein